MNERGGEEVWIAGRKGGREVLVVMTTLGLPAFCVRWFLACWEGGEGGRQSGKMGLSGDDYSEPAHSIRLSIPRDTGAADLACVVVAAAHSSARVVLNGGRRE
jgi:hypothetical protein